MQLVLNKDIPVSLDAIIYAFLFHKIAVKNKYAKIRNKAACISCVALSDKPVLEFWILGGLLLQASSLCRKELEIQAGTFSRYAKTL